MHFNDESGMDWTPIRITACLECGTLHTNETYCPYHFYGLKQAVTVIEAPFCTECDTYVPPGRKCDEHPDATPVVVKDPEWCEISLAARTLSRAMHTVTEGIREFRVCGPCRDAW